MKNLNKKRFDAYPNDSYFKSSEKGDKKIRLLKHFPEALGYDAKSGGFIVVHHRHKANALNDELPVCLILKNMGFGIELIEESDERETLDVVIHEIASSTILEIKRLYQAKDLANGILLIFRRTYKKASKLLLHVDMHIQPANLKRAIRKAHKRYPDIQLVWLVYRNHLTVLTTELMQRGNYFLP